MQENVRCWSTTDPLYIRYHDEEWGVPLHDDRKLFEFLVLEGFQAGLTWAVILRKRDAFRRAFDNFDPARVASYTDKDVERILGDQGVIRNRAKIRAAISNARCFLDTQREFGSFDAFIWRFVQGRVIDNGYASLSELPAETSESRAMSRELKEKGFKFVGPTICYAFMQAAGLVNDHIKTCFRYRQLSRK